MILSKNDFATMLANGQQTPHLINAAGQVASNEGEFSAMAENINKAVAFFNRIDRIVTQCWEHWDEVEQNRRRHYGYNRDYAEGVSILKRLEKATSLSQAREIAEETYGNAQFNGLFGGINWRHLAA